MFVYLLALFLQAEKEVLKGERRQTSLIVMPWTEALMIFVCAPPLNDLQAKEGML